MLAADSGAVSVLGTIITGVFALIVTWMQVTNRRATERVHAELKTNDGRRAGDYIEQASRSVAMLHVEHAMTRAMVEALATKAVTSEQIATLATREQLDEHTVQDLEFQDKVTEALSLVKREETAT